VIKTKKNWVLSDFSQNLTFFKKLTLQKIMRNIIIYNDYKK